MDIVDKILKHPLYIDCIRKNNQAEKERVFCGHDLRHAVDVARVAYIIALEDKLNLEKDIIYAAALLHDIGKWKQYLEGLDHAEESSKLAQVILSDSGMNAEQTSLILDAIRSHRKPEPKKSALSEVLYKGDKACRLCIECNAIGECDRFINDKQPKLKY